MGNSASSQGSSTGTHDGDVGSSVSEEQHDWPIEQAEDTPDVQSLQEMRKPYICNVRKLHRPRMSYAFLADSVNTTFGSRYSCTTSVVFSEFHDSLVSLEIHV